MPEIVDKKWDSDFFGFKTGELHFSGNNEEFSQMLRTASDNNYRLLYWKIPTNNIENNQLAAVENLFLGDTKMVYQIPAVANLSPEIKQQVHSWNQPPNEQLISLGITSGEFSRFKTDPKMPNGFFEKMYTEWVKQSVQGTMGNVIYYIGNGTLIKGFVTLQFHPDYAEIGLIAVHENYRKQNIASNLIHYAAYIAFAHNLKNVHVATQLANIPANNLYTKCGGTIISSENIFHIWL